MLPKRPTSLPRFVARRPRNRYLTPQNYLLLGFILLGATVYYIGHKILQHRFKQSSEQQLPPDVVQLPPALRTQPSVAFCSKSRPPLVCAHGGDTSQGHPPNTAGSLQSAIALRADCVEIDVARSKDQQLVAMHRRDLEQLSGRPGVQAADFTLQQLMAMRWATGESPMMVVDAVNMVAPHVDVITLDLKTYDDMAGRPIDEELLAQQVVALVHQASCGSCIVWAKSDRLVQLVKQLSPGQQVGYVVMNQTREARQAGMHRPLRLSQPEVVAAYYGMVDQGLRNQVKGADKQLYTWTVNDVGAIQQVLQVGVDGVVTSRAKLVRDAIDYQLQRCYEVA